MQQKNRQTMKLMFFISLIIIYCSGCVANHHLRRQPPPTQLGENIFTVSFKGKGCHDWEEAFDMALFRSADVALGHGFGYFVIINSERYSDEDIITTPTRTESTSRAYVVGNHIRVDKQITTRPGETQVYSSPRIINTIACYKGKPDIDRLVYDAVYVYDSIKAKYRLQ